MGGCTGSSGSRFAPSRSGFFASGASSRKYVRRGTGRRKRRGARDTVRRAKLVADILFVYDGVEREGQCKGFEGCDVVWDGAGELLAGVTERGFGRRNRPRKWAWLGGTAGQGMTGGRRLLTPLISLLALHIPLHTSNTNNSN